MKRITTKREDQIQSRGLHAKEAAKYCGLGRSTFLRYVSEGKAPAPRRLQPGSVVWLRDVLDKWLEQA
ncbi:MAG: helix-turn-helix transcriptional regulator [Acidobacteriaceae bacterium]